MFRFIAAVSAVIAFSVSAGQPNLDTISVRLKPGDVLDKQWQGGDQAGQRNLLFFGVPADLAKAPFVDKSGKVTPPEKWREISNTEARVAFARDKSNIEKGKTYAWVFSGAFDIKGKGTGPAPTWTVNTKLEDSRLVRVEIFNHHGDVEHGSTKAYFAKAFDENNKLITDKCSFKWKVEQGSEVKEFTGTSIDVTYLMTVLSGTAKLPTPKFFLGPKKTEKVTITLYGWGCGVDESNAKTDRFTFDIVKGSVVKSYTTDENKTATGTRIVGLKLRDVTVIPKTPPPLVPETVKTTLKSNVVVTASFQVTGTAKAAFEPLGVGVDVTIGTTVGGSASVTTEVSKEVTVTSSPDRDIRLELWAGQEDNDFTWDSFTVTEYSSGYKDYEQTGKGKGSDAVRYFEVRQK